MSSTPRFSTPPVQEAIVELSFEGTDDLTVLGRLHERIRADFPEKEREVAPPLFGPPVDAPETMRFYRADRTALVRAGEGVLSVHHLGTHPGWETLKVFAAEQLAVYREVAAPNRLEHASVRYVNRVTLPGPEPDVARHFRIGLPWPPDVAAAPARDLYVQTVLPYPDDALDLHVYLVQIPTDGDGLTLVLDLIAHATEAPSFDALPHWLDRAHGRIRAYFDRAFTDAARTNLFGELP